MSRANQFDLVVEEKRGAAQEKLSFCLPWVIVACFFPFSPLLLDLFSRLHSVTYRACRVCADHNVNDLRLGQDKQGAAPRRIQLVWEGIR